MKIGITTLCWTAITVGVFSQVHAQQDYGPCRAQAAPLTPADWGHVQSIGQDTTTATPPSAPVVSTDDFPQPITDSVYGSCDGDWCGCNDCCGNDCCDSGWCCCLPGWRVKFVPYGWLSEIHGNATVRGVTNDVHLSTRDLLNLLEHNVHFFFSGKLEMEQEQGPLGIITNGYYINAGFGNAIEGFNFSSQFEQAIVDVALAYELEGMAEMLWLPPGSKLDLLAGARYWMLKGGVTITGPLGRSASFNGKKEWVDPFVGARAIVPLNCWSNLQVRGDVGGFDWGTASDYTWNLEALVEMACSPCCALRAGYRILDVDQQRGSGNDQFAFDVQYRGPVMELALTF